MSKTIWKFPLQIEDEQLVEMPANAHILCVQIQVMSTGMEVACLWALVDPTNPVEQRKILIAGTGHNREDLDGLLHYIGTFQMMRGRIVFHVFEAVVYGDLAPSEELMEASAST